MTPPDQNRSKEELSSAILQTASRLFNEYGVEAVSMHQIAKSAGVGQGTLYRRYANKADLCMGLMQNNFDQFRCRVSDFLESNAHQSAQFRLRGLLAIIIDFLDEKLKVLGVIQAQQLMEKKREDFFSSPPYQYLHGILSGLLASADSECLTQRIDPEFLAHTYIATISPHTYCHLVNTKGYTKKEVHDRFCSFYIDTLFKEKPEV
ncbi:TetR/AcrR family transcriptional regulator [Paenibacillus sp. GCM10027627]|uniref:TetR/AcrR family transcriptional regulator n=1 Tax=unclassified Paenibacillus TaxID=185978 RepID=UPI003631C2ED